MIITIDGPAGSGKSTAARKLSSKLQIAYLDTGAMYRAVTLKAMREGANLENEDALKQIARRMKLEMHPQDDGTLSVILDGDDVTHEIRGSDVTDNAHFVARTISVREAVKKIQHHLGKKLSDFVTEGRDQGSVVFPEADYKFYLDAKAETRAHRRLEELLSVGEDTTFEEVLHSIIERDRKDRTRTTAPLVTPQDAIIIDTTDNTIEQTTEQLLRYVEERG